MILSQSYKEVRGLTILEQEQSFLKCGVGRHGPARCGGGVWARGGWLVKGSGRRVRVGRW